MTFDLSSFGDFGAWLFQTGKAIYESLIFDFGDFQINGWFFLLGLAILAIVIFLCARLFE